MKSGWRLWLLLMMIGVILVGFILSGSDLFEQNQPVVMNGIAAPPLPTLVPEQVALGQTIYAQSCAACHGVNLEGKPNWKVTLPDGSLPPPPHDSSGHTWHHADELLLDIIANGGDPSNNSQMPAFNDKLTGEQMTSVLDFMKSKWGQEEREFQWWMSTVGDQQ